MPTPVSAFDYALPQEYIAQTPVFPRDSSRLFVLNRAQGTYEHRHVRDILSYLVPGDVVVFNTSKVFKARLVVEGGGEMFVSKVNEGSAYVLLRPGKKFKEGATIVVGHREFKVLVKHLDGVVEVHTGMSREELFAFCEMYGTIPTPPYVENDAITEAQYQTVYAKQVGSVAAPTAGLHFTPELFARMKARGVQIEEVLLHVGIGTFKPVQTEYIEDHTLHAEYVELQPDVADRLRTAKHEGRRIIAVGTTTTRVLEAVAALHGGEVAAYCGEVNIFITPGYTFRVIDGLLTNFHLPKSTLLMLVCAFAGEKEVLAAYHEAIAQKYRFFSFGDAMLIL